MDRRREPRAEYSDTVPVFSTYEVLVDEDDGSRQTGLLDKDGRPLMRPSPRIRAGYV
jgi:hypothetical protein